MKNRLILLVLFLVLPLLARSQKLTNAEYFIDTDPGLGNGTAITITYGDAVTILQDLDLTGITVGFHVIGLRFMDENGNWGFNKCQSFFAIQNNSWAGLQEGSGTSINKAEYFLDTDPGLGNGNPLTIIGGSTVTIATDIDLSGIAAGFHVIGLRFKDENGKWGFNKCQSFFAIQNNSWAGQQEGSGTRITKAEYFIDVDPGLSNGISFVISSGNSISVSTDLTLNTISLGQHIICVRFEDENGKWGFNSCQSFEVTDVTLATITTSSIGNVGSTSATGYGNVTSDGGATITARGICWSTSATPTISNSHTTETGTTGTFSSTMTGLSSSTVYHVRAYATNSKGTAYGDDATFTTLDFPRVSSSVISNVSANSAHSGGNVTSDGGSTITARGICWSTSATPTISNSHTTETGTTGTFSSTMTGLSSSTVYHVRAYATNSAGTAYGDELTFETAPNQITNLIVRSVSRTFIAIQWSRANGTGCMAVCLKGTSSNVVNPEYGTADYSANSTYGSGDYLGTGTTANYIVYKGTGNTLRVDGLTKNTQYTFKVYEYNLYNSYYSYATNTNSTNPLSRTTSPKEGYDPEWVDSSESGILSFKINPNPANDILHLSLTLEETANITIELFNMNGQNVGIQNVGTQNVGTHCNVSLPVNSSYQKGQYEIPIAIDKLASGSYYIVVSGNNELVVQDFVIVR